MARSTRSLRSALTLVVALRTWDTVPTETFASAATSLIVGLFPFPIGAGSCR